MLKELLFQVIVAAVPSLLMCWASVHLLNKEAREKGTERNNSVGTVLFAFVGFVILFMYEFFYKGRHER